MGYRTSVAGGGTSGTGDRSASITAAVGDYLVVCVGVSGNSNATPTCSDDQGGTYTRVKQALLNASADSMAVFVRDTACTTTNVHVVTVATGSNTSGEVCIVAISGVDLVGSAAVRQSAKNGNVGAGNTPSTSFGQQTLASSVTLGFVVNGSNPATITPPATNGFTERQDVGQATPNIGLECITSDSATVTTVTWGGTSATAFADIIIEIDLTRQVGATGVASSAAVGTAAFSLSVAASGNSSGAAIGGGTVNENLVASGKASAAAAGTPTVAQQIRPTGLASAAAFGTASFSQAVVATGKASDAAFGTAKVQLSIAPHAPTLASGVGSSKFAQNIVGAGVSSSAAFGSAGFGWTLDPGGLASSAAFGSSSFKLEVDAAGASSQAAAGTPSAKNEIDPSGVASKFATGNTKLGQQIKQNQWNSANLTGHPTFELSIAPSGLASGFATGNAGLASSGSVAVPGVSSQAAAGAASFSLAVAPAGHPSQGGVGAASLGWTIDVPGVASRAAVGSAIVASAQPQAISPAGVASAFAAGAPRLFFPAVIVPRASSVLRTVKVKVRGTSTMKVGVS